MCRHLKDVSGIEAQLHRGNANARPIAVWMNPLHWPEQFLQTPGPMEAKARIRGQQRADGRASSTGPRRSAAACWGHCFLWVTVVGAQLLATGHGKAVRTAAGPARADLGCTGCAAHLLRPGSPGPPERTHACGGLGVSRDDAARRKNSCASRPNTHPPSKKTSGTAAVRTGAAGQRVQPL